MSPIFDIVIPCASYHSERFLRSLPNLREISKLSCVGQIIVVCDGWQPNEADTDGLVALVLNASSRRRNGPSAVRNAANSLIVSPYVMYCDADVIPIPSTVLAHYAIHAEAPENEITMVAGMHKNVLIPGGAIGVFDQARLEEWVYPDIWRQQKDDWRISRLQAVDFDPDGYGTPLWAFAAGSNISLPFEWLLAVGAWHEAYQGWGYEDSDLWFRLMKSGVQVRWITDYFYHQHHQAETATRIVEASNNHKSIFSKQIDDCVVTYVVDSEQSLGILDLVAEADYQVEAIGPHPLGASSPLGLRSVPVPSDALIEEFRRFSRGWFLADLRAGVFPDRNDWLALYPTSTRTYTVNGVVYVPEQSDGIVTSRIIRLGEG